MVYSLGAAATLLLLLSGEWSVAQERGQKLVMLSFHL